MADLDLSGEQDVELDRDDEFSPKFGFNSQANSDYRYSVSTTSTDNFTSK